MTPLYINGKARIRLDGPALRVSLGGQADRLFPLRRVSRVVSASRAAWATKALMACASRGITVSFVDGRGRIVAHLLGDSKGQPGLARRLRELTDRPDWRPLYDTFLAATNHRFARALAARLGLALRPHMGFTYLETAVFDALARYLPRQDFASLRQGIDGLLSNLVLKELGDWGIGTHSQLLKGADLNLVADLVSIMRWPVLMELLDWAAVRAATGFQVPLDRRELIGFFEERADRTNIELRELLHRLWRWAEEVS